MSKFFGNAPPGTNQAEIDGQGAELPGIAVLVSDRAPQLVRWDLEIGALTDGRGWTRVGRVLTVPPALATVYAVPRVASAARVVALASCPGAKRWRVTGRAVPLDTNGTSPAIVFDPVVVLREAQADVLVSPYDVATGAIGVEPVEAELRGSPVVTVSTFQVAVAAVATQVLPEDELRLRAWLRVVAGGPVFLGPNTVTGANGLALFLGDPPWEYDPRRPLFAADPAAAAVLSVMVQRG
jgi:hypothetical protein